MSNDCFLVSSDQPGEPLEEDHEIRSGINTIPLLWLSCFHRRHIFKNDENVVFLDSRTVDAIEICYSRRAVLEDAFNGIGESYLSWLEMLKSLEPDRLKVDLDEVLELMPSGEHDLSAALVFFESPTQDSLDALFRLTDLPLLFGEEMQLLGQSIHGVSKNEFLLGRIMGE